MVRILQKPVWTAVLVCTGVWAQISAQTPNVPENPYIQPQVNVRQLPVNTGAAALWQDLQRLHTRASLLMIVAHPDDEDSGMLTYEARGNGVRTGMLTLTRGEGGQNVMTADLNDALGLLRTQELLKEDEYTGVDQMWGTVADFGFSKTMDETLANWSYDRVLCDAVRAVRIYRPLVITSVFIGGVTDGHGHHQVAGRLAQEVFNAAGDPSACADQIQEGLQPWQPLKVYARVPSYSISGKGIYDYATGKYAEPKFYNYVTKTWSSETPSTDVVIPEGTYSPLLGMSYWQWSRIGWGQQLSQYGGSALPPAGEMDVAYHRYASRVQAPAKETSFFDGIDTSLAGIAALAPDDKQLSDALKAIDADISQAMQQFSVTDTAKIAPLLADAAARIKDLLEQQPPGSGASKPERYTIRQELLQKQAQVNDALVYALGLSMRAQAASAVTGTGATSRVRDNADTELAVTPGEEINIRVESASPYKIDIQAPETALTGVRQEFSSFRTSDPCNPCGKGPRIPEPVYDSQDFGFKPGPDALMTRPYFTRPGIEQPYYEPAYVNAKPDDLFIAKAWRDRRSIAPYPATAWNRYTYNNVSIYLGEVVQTAHKVVGQGTVYQPLVVVPAISVALSPQAGVIPLEAKSVALRVTVRGDAPSADGTVSLKLPEGWTADPESLPFHFTRRGEELITAFTVTPKHLSAQQYTISAVAESGGRTYTEGYTTVGYAGLTPTNLYRTATYRTRGVDVHVAPGVRVAYVMGSGDEVPAAIEALGIHPRVLAVSELAGADLKQYDEVFLGVRAFNAHPELAQITPKLVDFAKAGGVVVMQYNTMPFASVAEHAIAPYPFALKFAENVVEEKAPVTLLAPTHPLLSWPNQITSHDFDNWVAERGHSFLTSWDEHYVALTETHDAGQDPQRGGLLFAKVGCGAYVYAGYALYRQLPEGVPGAYRLLANLLSLPKNPQALHDANTCKQN